jgi:hypothetical protein
MVSGNGVSLEKNVTTISPASPGGASWMCAAVGDAMLLHERLKQTSPVRLLKRTIQRLGVAPVALYKHVARRTTST